MAKQSNSNMFFAIMVALWGFILIPMLVYCASSFVIWDWNPANWSEMARFLTVGVTLGIYVVTVYAVGLIKIEDMQDGDFEDEESEETGEDASPG